MVIELTIRQGPIIMLLFMFAIVSPYSIIKTSAQETVTLSGEIAGNPAYNDRIIYITGSIYIKDSLTITNCHVYVTASNAKIVVEEGASLILIGSTLNGSSGIRYYIQVLGGSIYIENSVIDLCGISFGSYGDESGIYGLRASITIQDTTIRRPYIGVFASNSSVEISGVSVSNFASYGIVIYNNSKGSISDSIISSGDTGIWVWSSQVEIIGNRFSDLRVGISLSFSFGAVIKGNTLENIGDIGLGASSADQITVENNTFRSCGTGLEIIHTDFGEVKRNSFLYCGTGLYLNDTCNITIFRNNFIGNSVHAVDAGSNAFNSTIGNYWEGFSEVDSNRDGIIDVAYYIDNDSVDYRPLAMPAGPPKILNLTFIPSVPNNNETTQIYVEFFDDGQSTVTISWTLSGLQTGSGTYQQTDSYPPIRTITYNFSIVKPATNITVTVSIQDDEGNVVVASTSATVQDVLPPSIEDACMHKVSDQLVTIYIKVVEDLPDKVLANYTVVATVENQTVIMNGTAIAVQINETYWAFNITLGNVTIGNETYPITWDELEYVNITVFANDTSGHFNVKSFHLVKPSATQSSLGRVIILSAVAAVAIAGLAYAYRAGYLQLLGARLGITGRRKKEKSEE